MVSFFLSPTTTLASRNPYFFHIKNPFAAFFYCVLLKVSFHLKAILILQSNNILRWCTPLPQVGDWFFWKWFWAQEFPPGVGHFRCRRKVTGAENVFFVCGMWLGLEWLRLTPGMDKRLSECSTFDYHLSYEGRSTWFFLDAWWLATVDKNKWQPDRQNLYADFKKIVQMITGFVDHRP